MPLKSVTVSDYMARNLVTFRPSDRVFDAMSIMLDRGISGGPVVDDDGRLLGVLSEADLMRVVVQGGYYDESGGLVGDYMRSPVDTVRPSDDIFTLAGRFAAEHRRRFPVVDDGRLVGQISRRDVLRAVREFVTHAA